MAKNIGIFVCGCRGSISETIDFSRLEEDLFKLKKSVGARVLHPWLCGAGGRELIKEKILNDKLDCVVIAGCPERVNRNLFDSLALESGLGVEMIIRLDIREGCAYPHLSNPDGAYRKTVNLIRMWTARARLMQPFHPVRLSGKRDTLVIGGGLAGLTAALDLAEAGINVTLIEKERYLGGNAARLNRIFPRMCEAGCGVTYLYKRIYETGRVRILTHSEIKSIRGSAGRYEATVRIEPGYITEGCNWCGECIKACPAEIPDKYNYGLGKTRAVQPPFPLDPSGIYNINRKYCPDGCDKCVKACSAGAVDFKQEPEEITLQFGSAVVASGWSPYPVEKVDRYGYGVFPDVITSMQMERLAAKDGPTGGRILCPGNGREAGRVVFIQCAGSRDVWHQSWCSTVCCTASIKQALYIKENKPETRVYIFYNDIRTPGEYEDLYVKAQEAGVVFIRTNPAEINADPAGGLKIIAEDTLRGHLIAVNADLVVLASGMTPSGDILDCLEKDVLRKEDLVKYGLVGKSGFHTGHRQCFPMETAAQGIYFAGCSQEPMDMARTAESALAASGRVLKAASVEIAVSPYVAVVDKAGCDKCKRCIEECPFGVFQLDKEGFPVPDGLFCRGCHICVGSCPRQCIIPQGFDIKQQAAMISAKIKELAPGEPVVICFMCENDAYIAAEEAGRKGIAYPANIHIIPVRCIGSVNMALLKDGISAGIDGFILAGCRSGECHHINGSDRAEERLENLKDTLGDMLIDPERIKILRLGIGDAKIFAEEAGDLIDRLRQMGPNPFRTAFLV